MSIPTTRCQPSKRTNSKSNIQANGETARLNGCLDESMFFACPYTYIEHHLPGCQI